MNREFAAIGLFACMLSTVACSEAPPPAPPPVDNREAEAKALHDLEDTWNKEGEARDLEKMVGHYTDDATLMAPGMPAAKGKEAIRKMLKEMLADPALSLKFNAARVEVAKSGDVGFTQGSYTMDMTDPVTKKVIHDKGSYVTGYMKQADGVWKAVSDISTSEIPPTPAKK
jgi:uncharacterized protein (TIGR02246 family)